MELDVKTKAHRRLKGIAKYRKVENCPAVASRILAHVILQTGELPIGIYENEPDETEDCVLLTDQGLHVNRQATWEFVPFDGMAGIDFDRQADQSEVNTLVVTLLNGERVEVSFRGRDPKYGLPDANTMFYFILSCMGSHAT